MNKSPLITNILQYLTNELANCKLAANNAHLAAIDDQSVAETQYDTLAIESAYLAEGQSRRIADFELAIQQFEQLKIQLDVDKTEVIKVVRLGSLVQLSNDAKDKNWFYLAPAAAGYKFTVLENNYTVITPKSPMGIALINKSTDEEVEVLIGNNKLVDDIIAIY